MPVRRRESRRRAYSELDLAAIAYACLLSIACLARGAVYDGFIALMLVVALPMLWLAMAQVRPVHVQLLKVGQYLLAALVIVLLAQWIFSGKGPQNLWPQVGSITGQHLVEHALQDKWAWLASIARLLLFVITFVMALLIGASEASTRIFFQTLLASGVACLTITFFFTVSDGVPTSTFYSYHHGFVNPNNAAAYLGVMLLLTLLQAVRFFKLPNFSEINLIMALDQLTVRIVSKAGYILYSMCLVLAGLFMTGSRAGILLSLLSALAFLLMIAHKATRRSKHRPLILFTAMLLTGTMLGWSYGNFGQIIKNKMRNDGISSNSRTDIMAATLPMIADHPLLGSGLGSFPGVFQQYRPTDVSADGIIDKAHNSYLEFAAEMGVPALAALLGALGWMGWQLYRAYRQRSSRYSACAFGLCAWLLAAYDSLVDFPLQIPGLAAVFIAVVTVCTAQTDPRFLLLAKTAQPAMQRVRVRKRRRGPPVRAIVP